MLILENLFQNMISLLCGCKLLNLTMCWEKMNLEIKLMIKINIRNENIGWYCIMKYRFRVCEIAKTLFRLRIKIVD